MAIRTVFAVLCSLVFSAPAGHAEHVAVRGLTCGLSAGGESILYGGGDPNIVHGVVTGGPVVIDAGEQVRETQIECAVDVNGYRYPVRSATRGPVGALADVMVFFRLRTDSVSLCTTVRWVTQSGTASRDLGCVEPIRGEAIYASGEYTVVPTAVLS